MKVKYCIKCREKRNLFQLRRLPNYKHPDLYNYECKTCGSIVRLIERNTIRKV